MYLPFSWPPLVQWLRWVGCDPDVGAVVIAVATWVHVGMLSHPLDDLKRALLAVDVGELDVGFPRFGKGTPSPFGWSCVMLEEAVRKHGDLRWALDHG